MATRSLGRLTLDLVAKIGGYESSMTKVNRLTKSTMKDVEKWTNAAAKTLAGLGVAASASTVVLVQRSAQAAKELQNFAFRANATTKEMQVLSFAGRDFGLSSEKIADILKDVNDRVGDFLSEGAGPMTRFFEQIAPKVGVTAEQFRNLSGPQALQLYVSSLDKANISHAEATTYMEELASDATALLPLIRDNGRELGKYAQRAEELGVILSETEVDNLADVSRQMEELGLVMDVTGKRIAAGAAPAISDLMEMLQDRETIEALQDIGSAMVTTFTTVVNSLREAVKFAQWAGEEIARIANGVSGEDLVGMEQQIDTIKEWMAGNSMAGGGRLRFFGKDGLVEYYDDAELKQMLDELVKARDDLQERMEKRKNLFGGGSGPEPSNDPGSAGAGSSAETSAFNPYAAVPPVLDEYIQQQEKLNTLVDDYLANSRRSRELLGEESEAAKVLYEIEHGRFAGLGDARQQALVDAAERMDAAREEQRLQEETQEKHREAMELASEYRAMAMSEEERAMESLKVKLEEIRTLVADGLLTQEEGSAAAEVIKENLDGLKEKVKENNKEMSVFADEAARNMQGAFADFLFDPFEDGLDGMLKNFGKILQRMAAEAAAAKVFEFMGFGGGGGGDKKAGGFMDLIGGFMGFFDAGGNIPSGGWGVVGERGPEIVSGPANVIGRQATAGLMAGGGTPNVQIINNGEPASASASMMEDGTLQIVLNAMNNRLREDLSAGRGVWREGKQKFGWTTKGAI